MIKKARSTNKLTQKELALRCNLSQSYLSKLEAPLHQATYKINPSLVQIATIAKELDLNPYELSNWFVSKILNNNKTEFSSEISFSISTINQLLGGDIFENSNLLT